MASELKVDTIKHTNNTSAITLDTSGNVTLSGSANNLGTVSAGTLGSSVVLPDGTICGFTETTTTPTGTQGTDTSYTTLTGSSVDYTPVSGSSFVVYEYQFGFTGRDNNPLLYWQSYYDGSIIANMDSGFSIHGLMQMLEVCTVKLPLLYLLGQDQKTYISNINAIMIPMKQRFTKQFIHQIII